MKTVLAEKPRIVQITDPDEIAAICDLYTRNEGINGFQDARGTWYAYAYSVERWRKRRAEREKDQHE